MTPPDRPAVAIVIPRASTAITEEPAAPRRSRPSRLAVLTGLIGAWAVLVAGTGMAVAVGLAGGGPQPADVLPADALAVLSVDLDPSADQKLKAYGLSRRFPDLGVEEEGDVRDALLRAVLTEAELDYDADVRDWIGDRAAVAAVPDADDDGLPDVLVALAVEDRDEATAALGRLQETSAGEDLGFFAFSDQASYVLLASTQEAADAAAQTEDVLADEQGYQDALDTLEGDQVVTGWADVEQLWASTDEAFRDGFSAVYGGDLDPKGQYVAGLHLESDYAEVTGRGIGLDLGNEVATSLLSYGSAPTSLIARLPMGVVGAASIGGLGSQVDAVFGALSQGVVSSEDLALLASESGLELPEDVVALVADDIAVALLPGGESPRVVARSRGGDVERARAAADKLLGYFASQGSFEGCLATGAESGVSEQEAREVCAELPSEAELAGSSRLGIVTPFEDGLAYATSDEELDALVSQDELGGSQVFRDALPDLETASTAVFVDLDALLELIGEDDEQAAPLRAVGFTAAPDANDGFRLRLTFD